MEFSKNSCKFYLSRLTNSKFRTRFSLKQKDFEYISSKSLAVIENHAYDFIKKRLTPAIIPNDGKQTPMRGHPVFIAQHATATCCRGCLEKWYKIPKGRELSQNEIDFAVQIIMAWIKNQIENSKQN